MIYRRRRHGGGIKYVDKIVPEPIPDIELTINSSNDSNKYSFYIKDTEQQIIEQVHGFSKYYSFTNEQNIDLDYLQYLTDLLDSLTNSSNICYIDIHLWTENIEVHDEFHLTIKDIFTNGNLVYSDSFIDIMLETFANLRGYRNFWIDTYIAMGSSAHYVLEVNAMKLFEAINYVEFTFNYVTRAVCGTKEATDYRDSSTKSQDISTAMYNYNLQWIAVGNTFILFDIFMSGEYVGEQYVEYEYHHNYDDHTPRHFLNITT